MSGLKPITVNTPTEDEAHIYAEDDAAIYQSLFGEDGVSSVGQACKATVLSNNKVRVADGVICVGGHFARIPYGDYIDCEIENGQSGQNRNDIIVARFETTGTGGIDTYTCEVKKGMAGSTATDPEIVQEDLYKAGKVRELPLYRVKIEGMSITAVEQLFTLRKTNEELEKELVSLNSKMITGDFVQLATAGAIKNQTVYKDIENINNYKMVALYCNYSSGYYCNPLICSVELFKTMTWIISDRRDNNQNYSAMLHYESDTRVKFVTVNADAALYGIR